VEGDHQASLLLLLMVIGRPVRTSNRQHEEATGSCVAVLLSCSSTTEQPMPVLLAS
jgi:hypothetical protein